MMRLSLRNVEERRGLKMHEAGMRRIRVMCGLVCASPAASGLQGLRVELHDLSEQSSLVLSTHARALVGDHHHQPARGRAGSAGRAWIATANASGVGVAVGLGAASTTAATSRRRTTSQTSGQTRGRGRGRLRLHFPLSPHRTWREQAHHRPERTPSSHLLRGLAHRVFLRIGRGCDVVARLGWRVRWCLVRDEVNVDLRVGEWVGGWVKS